MDEALGAEAREQPLGDALLEVQVDGVLGQHACVLEDDRPDRRLAAPVGELLVALARGARSVSSVAAQLGSVAGAPVERRERPDAAGRARPASRRAARRRAARASRRARRGTASARSRPSAASASSRVRQRSICAFRSSWRSRAASSSSSVTRFRSASRSAASISRASSLGVARGGCRWPSRRSMSSSMTFERLPSSRLIVSVFRTSTSRTRSSARCGRRSSGSGPRRPAGACGRCGRCAARCGRGSRARRSGRGRRSAPGSSGPRGRRRWRCRMRSGSFAGSVLNRRWISLRARAARQAVDHRDALVGAVGAGDRLLEDRLRGSASCPRGSR